MEIAFLLNIVVFIEYRCFYYSPMFPFRYKLNQHVFSGCAPQCPYGQIARMVAPYRISANAWSAACHPQKSESIMGASNVSRENESVVSQGEIISTLLKI